jgi:hypothetical protein
MIQPPGKNSGWLMRWLKKWFWVGREDVHFQGKAVIAKRRTQKAKRGSVSIDIVLYLRFRVLR